MAPTGTGSSRPRKKNDSVLARLTLGARQDGGDELVRSTGP